MQIFAQIFATCELTFELLTTQTTQFIVAQPLPLHIYFFTSFRSHDIKQPSAHVIIIKINIKTT